MSLEAGKVLQSGKYILGPMLAQGDYSATYRATQVEGNQPVILTALNDRLRRHPNFAQFQKLFFAEARCVGRCHHPNLVRILDFFEQDQGSFMVSEYIPGQTLMAIVQATGPFSEARAIHYIRQVGMALTVVHQNGMLHRDITPQNLIRRQPEDRVVLVNFGVAREAALEILKSRESSFLAGYAPPEQYDLSVKRTISADLYALAATLYTLVTGQVPIAAPLRDRVPLPDLQQFSRDFSPPLMAAIQQGMALDAGQRPSSVEAWLALLPQTISPPQEAAPKTGTYPWLAASPGFHLAGQPAVPLSPPIPSASIEATTATQLPPELVAVQTPIATPTPIVSKSAPEPAPKRWFPQALLLSSVISILLGMGVGLAIRFGWLGSRSNLLNAEQTFPPLKDMPLGAQVKPASPPDKSSP
ncbi:serine/threonine-protein kinase [Leptolyngbya sp. 'hensonii']|uniref:serine/threonine protein kinase n=1 Tax=Leptolyngbya sp. 'hensonii' TaxID=1922337 RepID=UPI0015C56BAB|nr:serine/threonine-protein kinase [Leptolyngbya sp. 'hensonii']